MDLLTEDKILLIKSLKQLDCCSRCILRFLGVQVNEGGTDHYMNPENYFNGNPEVTVQNIEVPIKKLKPNPCRSCLGILEDITIEKYVQNLSLDQVTKYNHNDFITVIILPKSLLIREHGLILYLNRMFPDLRKQDIPSLKKILRSVSVDSISKKINKVYRRTADLELLIDIQYEDDDKEVKSITHLKSLNSYKNVGRTAIENILKKCDEESFKQCFSVPPDVPVKGTTANITFSTKTIYIGGRYLKFSRNMGQTPWIINDKPMAEHCLSNIIFDSVCKILKCDKSKLTFTAGGREDHDVRMLGNGRPFYIEIVNPISSNITFEDCRDIEMDILKSDLMAVIKLQKVYASDLRLIKEGEELKKKHYHALCYSTFPDIKTVVEKINNFSNVRIEIQQKTPLRVLHRRTLAVRNKIIYALEATPISGHSSLFFLKLITQAGTYVKEFVHGDFYRTKPSLSEIAGHQIDIVALDVTKMELQWPS